MARADGADKWAMTWPDGFNPRGASDSSRSLGVKPDGRQTFTSTKPSFSSDHDQ